MLARMKLEDEGISRLGRNTREGMIVTPEVGMIATPESRHGRNTRILVSLTRSRPIFPLYVGHQQFPSSQCLKFQCQE